MPEDSGREGWFARVVFSGKKWDQKEYTWTTGYPGLRKETASRRQQRHPDRILSEAVRRMLPKNKLAVKMLAKLNGFSALPAEAQSFLGVVQQVMVILMVTGFGYLYTAFGAQAFFASQTNSR